MTSISQCVVRTILAAFSFLCIASFVSTARANVEYVRDYSAYGRAHIGSYDQPPLANAVVVTKVTSFVTGSSFSVTKYQAFVTDENGRFGPIMVPCYRWVPGDSDHSSNAIINSHVYGRFGGDGLSSPNLNQCNIESIDGGDTDGSGIYPDDQNAWASCGGKGISNQPSVDVGLPINVGNGNMWLSQNDYEAPGLNGGLSLTRTYNSGVAIGGGQTVFGGGWTSELDESLQFVPGFSDGLVSYSNGTGRTFLFAADENGAYTQWTKGLQAKLLKTVGGNYRLDYDDGSTTEFYSNGRLMLTRDRNGNQTAFHYDNDGQTAGTGKLIRIVDPANREFNILYFSSTEAFPGFVKSISDSIGTAIASYSYSLDAPTNSIRLTGVTYNSGLKYGFEYENKVVTRNGSTKTVDLLKKITDGAVVPNVLEYHTYDSQGRAVTSGRATDTGAIDKYTIDYPTSTQSYTKVTDGLGRESQYFTEKRNGRHVLTKLVGSCGCGTGSKLSLYEYDAQLHVTKVSTLLSVEGSQKTFNLIEYADFDKDNPKQITETVQKVDGDGTVIESTLIGTTKITYNSFGQVKSFQDKIDSVDNRDTVVNTFDENGNLKTTTNELGTTTFLYDAVSRGLPKSIIDPRQNETRLTWDPAGFVSTVTDARGKLTQIFRDARSRVFKTINALNHTTLVDYSDDATRTVTVTLPNNDQQIYEFDVRGLLWKFTDERKQETVYEHDSAYRLTKITDPSGNQRVYDYDLMSHLMLSKDGYGRQTDYKFDQFGRPEWVKYPAAHAGETFRMTKYFVFDEAGRLKTFTDSAGRATNYKYYDQLLKATVTTADLKTTSFEYTKRGKLKRLTDAKDQHFDFTYDSLGNVKSESRGGLTELYDYDAVGNLKSRTDYAGEITTYRYDSLNRLHRVIRGDEATAPESAWTTARYEYDDLSRLIEATNDVGTVSFGYDNLNRLVSTTDVFNNTIIYDYVKTIDPAASTKFLNQRLLKFNGNPYATYNYDASERLSSVVDADDGKVVAFGYNANNMLTSRSFQNGTSTEFASTFEYDNVGRIETITNGSSAISYRYNDASRIENITSGLTGSTDYLYDDVDRLTGVGSATTAYGYDQVGNITKSPQASSQTYETGRVNQIKSMIAPFGAETQFEHDAKGNVIRKYEGDHLWRYTYDTDNRLVSVSDHRKNSVRYRYDALGRRVQRSVSGGRGTTKFVYDGDDVLVDDDKGVLTKYLNADGIDNKLRMKSGNGPSKYFITDHLGSTIGLADSTGSVTNATSYDAFGNTSSTIPTRYRYTGREYDDFSGLYHYRSRSYDPKTGRFMSEDPIGLSGGINLFAYVGNNPLNFSDPSGLFPEPEVGPVTQTVTQFSTLLDEVIANSTETRRNARLLSEILENHKYVAGAGATGGTSALVAYGGTSVTAAGAAPVAVTVGVGLAVGGAIGLPIGIYTSEMRSNPFVNGSWNLLGKSAEEVANEPWSPMSPTAACKIHGNSAASQRPTWGYLLYQEDGTFLKNGITSRIVPENRYTKGYMNDKYMIPIPFPNRRNALDWEYERNMTNPGPLNFERYIKR